MKPRCFGCGDKPARKLNLPGAYGEVEAFCSLRCAARHAVEPHVIGCHVWSKEEKRWLDESEQTKDWD